MSESTQDFALEAIKRSTNELNNASSISDIRNYLNQYDESQAEGVLNHIKGITHELEYQYYENHDGDSVMAELFPDTNHPGSDIILTDQLTGNIEEVQLKATDSIDYIKGHVEQYPNIRVLATEEVAEKLGVESTGISDKMLTHEVQKVLKDLGMEGFDDDILEYSQMHALNDHIDTRLDSVNGTLHSSLGDLLPELGNAFATGGFLALIDILKNNPEKQKKVINAGIVAGLLDGIVDFHSLNLENGFDLNPLLIASLGSWIVMQTTNVKNQRVRAFGKSFGYVTNMTFKTLEYGSYIGLGAELVDLLAGLEVVGFLGDAVDSLDFLDVVDDGVNLVDGFASLGVGILLSKGVKSVFDNMNRKDQEKIFDLKRKVANKNILRKLLQSNAPVPLLIGPYNEIK